MATNQILHIDCLQYRQYRHAVNSRTTRQAVSRLVFFLRSFVAPTSKSTFAKHFSLTLSLSAALSKVATRQWSKLRPLSEFRARYRTGPYIASSSSPTSRTRSEKCFSSADQWTRALYSDSIDIFSRNVIVDCARAAAAVEFESRL